MLVVRGLWPHRGWSIFWPPPDSSLLAGWPLFCYTFHGERASACVPSTCGLFQSSSGCKRTTSCSFPPFPKTRSCFNNPMHLRRNSLRHYCTFHGKPDFPCFFFSTVFILRWPTGYLLLLPRRLNRGERAFCGIETICIANEGPCARMTAPYPRFQGLLQLSNIG